MNGQHSKHDSLGNINCSGNFFFFPQSKLCSVEFTKDVALALAKWAQIQFNATTAAINCKLFQEAPKWHPDGCDCSQGRLRNHLLPNKTPWWPFESIAPLWTVCNESSRMLKNTLSEMGFLKEGGGIPLPVKWLKDYHNTNNTHSIEHHNIFTEDNINFPQCGHEYAIQPCCKMKPFYSIPVVTWLKFQYDGGHKEDWVLH